MYTFKENPGKRQTVFTWSILIFVVAAVLGVSWYLGLYQKLGLIPAAIKQVYRPIGVFASSFAPYQEVPVSFTPQVPDYTVNSDLSNVINANDFGKFSETEKNLLAKNFFMVRPGYNAEFFPLYEKNRYALDPNFVTTDSILHNYHLMFDHLLRRLEEQQLAAELTGLSQNLMADAVSQYNSLKGTAWANAALRNVGFFAVGAKLLDSSVKIPEIVKDQVDQELALIEAHQDIKPSPVMSVGGGNLKEDYTQYVPRGHYDKTEQLKAYFKAMMWYGRLTFRLSKPDEVKSALLITLALGKDNRELGWNKIYEPINFFVGKSDDITYYQFKEIAQTVYGPNPDLATVAGDAVKLAAFTKSTDKLEPPQINSMPIFNADLEPDREKAIKGFRFMGQRFTIDAAIFQRLVAREVGSKGEDCANAPFIQGRMLPKGLDIPAALSSAEALDILTAQGETQYACYPENLAKMKNYLTALPVANWTQNLYWGWLNTLRSLIGAKGDGYPMFMKNLAWARKELNTFLGSWTELKHDTILYAKQTYAELGGGGPAELPVKDDRGYVEPNPYLYARLAGLLKMTNEGLNSRGLFGNNNSDSLQDDLVKLEQLALALKTISEKELNNVDLTAEEFELIRSYGGQLEHFWLEVNKDEPQFKELGQSYFMSQNPAAIVADVATDPDGSVLEDGTGYIFEIYTIVRVAGKLKIAKGGVYSYYEFTWPINDRLTDQKWRELLESNEAPALPDWTKEYIAPSSN